MDASQDQMQHDIVPKLFSNAASGYSIMQYFGNFLAEIFEHDRFGEGRISKFSLGCSFSIWNAYEDK